MIKYDQSSYQPVTQQFSAFLSYDKVIMFLSAEIKYEATAMQLTMMRLLWTEWPQVSFDSKFVRNNGGPESPVETTVFLTTIF